MTPNYSVIHNPYIGASVVGTRPRQIEAGDALGVMTGRQFHVVGDLVLSALEYVDPHAGGAFVTGARAQKRVRRLRERYPSIPLIVEPAAIRDHWASVDSPFRIDIGENELFSPSLDAALDLQRLDGGAVAVTPTGQIRTGDSATLKAVLGQANELDRVDTLVAIPVEAGWLSDAQLVKQITRVLDRSRHPVLLTFIHRANPLASAKRLRAYSQIFEETTGTAVAYRTDVAGLDATARGALTSAVGAYPSVRRLNPVGEHGFAIDPEDMSPHMLIGDMLRFVRSTHMRRVWFSGANPLICSCIVCDGGEVDRLFGGSADREAGHLHNIVELGRLAAPLLSLDRSHRRSNWGFQLSGALDTYPQLATHIGAPVPIPDDVRVWSQSL